MLIKASHRGRLRRAMGAKKGQKIPVAKLREAKQTGNAALKKEATFALNARKWRRR